MTVYQAILFDLDNTLYDYDAYWAQRLRRALHPVCQHDPRHDEAALVAQAMAGKVYTAQWLDFLRRAGVDDPAIQAASLAQYQINTYEALVLYPGTADVLIALRRYAALGLITNGPVRSQRPKIAQFALEQYMDVLIVSEEVGLAKPAPAIFHLALERLGVSPARALYVGDSLEHDLRGASAAGLDFVWMNPTPSI